MTPYYQDSAVTIYHGDCREIVPTLGRFDLLLTDPPYGMGDILTRAATGSRWKRNFENGPLSWDTFAPVDVVQNLIELCAKSIVWGGQFFNLPSSRGWLCWNKIIRNWSSSECELAWTNIERPNRVFDYSHGQLAHENKQHPTQKPLPLMTWCIGLAGDAQTILDPFAGSCTTARAAKDLGRKCVCIEREERYCEIGAKRMGQEVLAL
jgi:site-specific DNA-methyltransferase (adenine-specific)